MRGKPADGHSSGAGNQDAFVWNLNLAAADNHYMTLAWDRPQVNFDYYWLEVTGGNTQEQESTDKRRPNTCGNGTIIHPEQTQVICGPFDACSSVSVTVRTYSRGPPELYSTGITLNDLLMDGQDQTPPTNITMVPESSSRTRLHWSQPQKMFGTLESYTVTICNTLGTCDTPETLSDCAEHVTTETETVFDSKADTSYCVLIATKTRCGSDKITSRQVNAEMRTPLFELPDVSNLTTADVKNGCITLSWQRPQGRFDYYSIEVVENGSRIRSQHKLGLCANGTIIRPDKTKLTCGPFEPCTKLSYTMRTHLNGPPERASPGVTVKDIFIPSEVLPDVTNLRLVRVGPNNFTAAWTKPKVNLDYYWIEVIGNSSDGSRLTPGTEGSCVNGSIIHPDQTQVTCSQLQHCSKVDFKVRTHITGPPARTSSGVSLHGILIPASAPPEVTDLKLAGTEGDGFTVSFQAPYRLL
ncbi:hypothetical protein MTO96_007671 [Rhipicephalus appendiculatus]